MALTKQLKRYPPYGLAPQVKQLPQWIQVRSDVGAVAGAFVILCQFSIAARPERYSSIIFINMRTLCAFFSFLQAGCGDGPYICPEKDATFPADECPDEMPDLSNHSSCMADFLKANPAVYQTLKEKKTATGVSFAQCIKTGMDNKGHPHIKTVGVTAGDEESYEVFKDLFDSIISDRHNGYKPGEKHPTDMDVTKIKDIDIDPFNKYVLTTRVRTGRSIRGYRLPPAIEFEERRKLEAVVVKALICMKDDLKGDYFPLHGSQSYAPKPDGMSEEEEDDLRKTGNLFQEPDSTLLLASGMGRHWPDARHANVSFINLW